jgi:FKBP-type peptidyl-prolyl cis-trans isomerase 2
MRKAERGDKVRVKFTGCFDDGTRFAYTEAEKPLEVTIGSGKLIKCFEDSLIGMSEGVKKTVRLKPANAMGERRPELVSKVPRDLIEKEDDELKIGSRVRVKNKVGQPYKATIKGITDDEITIDANHPLAGLALNFDIEMIAFV